MEYFIKNDRISATFSSVGGELLSLKNADGLEYLWQGDEKYWHGRSPILFPYCCRLFGGYYTHKGQKFSGNLHGFIRHLDFSNVEVANDFIIFKKSADEETKLLYPFDFSFELKYTLRGSSLICDITVKNEGNEDLFYCQGMHPGFNVPLDRGNFDDWFIEFADKAAPRRIIFSESKFCKGDCDFSPALKDGKKLPLSHSLFDDEAIFLTEACRSLEIKSDVSEHSVTVDYPNAEAVGFWHPEFTDAPFVCVEPLGGIPSFDGVVDEISEKACARRVIPGESHTDTVTITLK